MAMYAPQPPNPCPAYVYKITTTQPPSDLPIQLPLSELDTKDGFIHLSTARRIPITAGLFFESLERLWVLKISVAESLKSGEEMRWCEDSGELWGCVHLYGGLTGKGLGKHNITGWKEYSKSGQEHWEEAITRGEEEHSDGFFLVD